MRKNAKKPHRGQKTKDIATRIKYHKVMEEGTIEQTTGAHTQTAMTVEHRDRLQRITQYIEAAKLGTSAPRIRVYERFSLMAAMRDTEMEQNFTIERLWRKWSWSTSATYVGAIVELKKGARETVSRRFQKFVKFIDAKALVEKKKPIIPVTKKQSRKLWKSLRRALKKPPGPTTRVQLAILLSWVFGQRPSDTLQLHGSDMATLKFLENRFTVITYRRGKTIASTGPFTIHVKRGQLTKWIKILLNERPDRFVFTPEPLPRDMEEIPPLIRQQMAKIASKLLRELGVEVRSVRRGGLQHLALLGMTLSDIRLHYSHHKSEQMLGRYLDHGTYSRAQAESHMTALQECEKKKLANRTK